MPVGSRDSFYGRLLGSPVASAGGLARAKSLSPNRRKQIAKKAAAARWDKEAIKRASKTAVELLPDSSIDEENLTVASFKKHIQFGV